MKTHRKFLRVLLFVFTIIATALFGFITEADAATQEKAIFPAPRVYLTQIAYESYSHGSHNAIDFSPGGNVFAPFTGKIVYKDARWGYVLFQSTNKVLYANGTLDYMTIGFMHDSDISNLYVGQIISQGQDFYQAGGMGNGNPNAYGVHVDMSIFRGRVNSVSSYGRGNVFAFDALFVNTNKTSIVYPGKVESGNTVSNGAPSNYNGLWKTTTSSVQSDTQKPTISNVKITNLSASGYTVTCTVSDNVGVTRVAFPTWTHANGQDDLFWRDGTISGNTATFRVNRSEHKGESGKYATHIYAYDAAGNSVSTGVDVTVPLDDISSCDDSHAVNNKHYSNAEQLAFQGWAFSNKAKKVTFKYILDSNAAVSVNNVNREDVKKAYPSTCSFTDVGYRFTLNLSKLSIGKHTVKVIATSASGTTKTVSNLTFYVDGHSHKFVSSGVTKKPTCTEAGIETVKCSVCSKSETRTVKALGHNYTVTETKATCKQYVGKKYTCSRCKHSYFVEGKKTWSEWSTTYPKNVDKSLIETKKEYRYSDYQTTTSYNSSVSGYTYLSSKWVEQETKNVKYVSSWPSGYPTNSGYYKTFSNSKVNSSETATTKTVASNPYVYGYIYYHWCRGTYTAGPINRTTKPAKTGEFNKHHAFMSSTNPSGLTASNDGSRIYSNASCCKDTYWYYPIPVYSQNYTIYKKLNTFFRWTSYSAWSATQYKASSTRKVETRTLYRYVTSDLGEHTEKIKVEEKATTSQDGKATSYCSVCNKKIGTPTIYKIKSIKLSSKTYTYNGKTKTPSVTVKDSKGNTLKKGTDYTVTYPKKRKSVGKYTVTVTFKGKYSGSKKLTFEIVPAKVTLSKLSVGKKQLTATWKTVSGITGYEVAYSTSKKFTKKTTKTVAVKKSKTKKTTIKKLKKGKKYYVKVRAYKTVNKKPVYGAWSAVKNVKVK